MTLPDDVKQPLLRSFHQKTQTPGWTFTGSGPNEKDRVVLVEYDKVVEEVGRLDEGYRSVIIDICHKMQIGMADFAHRAAISSSPSSPNGSIYLDTIEDYDLYCHYVAGLVGEGLSRIWSASGKEAEYLGELKELSNSMGLLLQKTNIIRDFREDAEERRFFWPREIWGREEYILASGVPLTSSNEKGGEVEDLYRDTTDAGKRRALYVQSGMVLDAMRHVTDSLDYLRLLRNQTVFNFCAIPAVMAIATLDLCYQNYGMFEGHIKIRKAEAAKVRSLPPFYLPLSRSFVFSGYDWVLMGLGWIFVVDHAVDEPERCGVHVQGLRTVDTPQVKSRRPKLHPYGRRMCQGLFLSLVPPHPTIPSPLPSTTHRTDMTPAAPDRTMGRTPIPLLRPTANRPQLARTKAAARPIRRPHTHCQACTGA